MSDNSTKEFRNGHGGYDSVSVALIGDDWLKKGISSAEAIYGNNGMNEATRAGVADYINARKDQDGN